MDITRNEESVCTNTEFLNYFPSLRLVNISYPKASSFICSLVCTIIWSKLPQYAPSCVLVVQIDPGACATFLCDTDVLTTF